MKKLGCAKCGGTKMSKGGSAGIVGMPKYGNNPRTSTGAMLKKGGSTGKTKPPVEKGKFNVTGQKPFASLGSKLGLGAGVAGIVGIAAKALKDKIKSRKEEKANASKPTARKGGSVVKKKVLNKAQYGQSMGPITESQSKFNNMAKASMGSLGQPPVPYANRPNAYESYNTQLDNDKRMQSENTKSENLYKQKKGGATKATKLAAVAPPKNKVTRADVFTRILKKKKK